MGRDGVGSGDDCCSFCDEMLECEGFSYNAANRACYLKGNFIGTFWNGGAVTRLKSSLGAGCPGFDDALQGKDLVGTLVEQWASPDPEACCAACARKEAKASLFSIAAATSKRLLAAFMTTRAALLV